LRKQLTVLWLVLITVLTLTACGGRHRYDTAERAVQSDGYLKLFASGMTTNLAMADLIAVIRVTDETEIPYEDDTSFSDMRYTCEILEKWYGEEDADTLQLFITGGKEYGCTKPHVKDELILFMSRTKDGTYVLVDDECSMFAINPPSDMLYAFSSVFRDFDGKSPYALKEAIPEAAERIAGEMDKWNGYLGDVYLNDFSYLLTE